MSKLMANKSILNSYQYIQNKSKFLKGFENEFIRYVSTMEKNFFASDSKIAKTLGCSVSTVTRTIRSLVEKGIIFKTVTMTGFRKRRYCHINYQTLKNLLDSAIEKSNQPSQNDANEPSQRRYRYNQNDDFHTVSKSDYSIKEEDSIKEEKGSYPKDQALYCTWIRKGHKKITERSITKIVGHVAGNVVYSSLTEYEKEVLENLGGKSTLNMSKGRLMSLCGRSGLDFNMVLAKSARI